MDSELTKDFLAQAESYLPTIRGGILICAQTGNTHGELNISLRQTIAIKESALDVNLYEVATIAGELEEKLKEYASLKISLTDEQARPLLDKLTELEILLAQISFNNEDFSIHITDFLEASFENLGFSEPIVQTTAEVEETDDEWEEEEFEIDEEMLEIFGEEAEELIQNIRVNLGRLEKNTNDREALLEVRRNAHTLKGSAGIVGLKDLSKVAHRVEDLLDYLAENEIAGNDKIFELLLVSTDCFTALAANETSAQLTKKIELLYQDFDSLMLMLKGKEGETQRQEDREKNELSVIENLPTLSAFANGAITSESKISDFNSEIIEEQKTNNKEQINEVQQSNFADQKTNPQAEISAPKSVVRVSLEKLDDLVKIMSGLVVSRSVFERRLEEFEQQINELHNSTRRLNHSTTKLETDFEADMLEVGSQQPTLSGFRSSVFSLQNSKLKSQISNPKSFDSLELDRYTEFHQTMRVLVETTGDTSAINAELDNLKGNLENLFENQRHLIEEMHNKLLRLRMVSFGSLTVRLQRTVRVTADEEGKTAELTIEGGNLEVDTQILDALIEPLLHLLRNAVAHGIESPETRRLLGKSETGQIIVGVHDEGTHFILTVTDDGRGLSADTLKENAIQKGFISQTEAFQMSEQEAFGLIFLAGLTTAGEISQVSGRGVGMNIVKAAVTRQQGTISIESEPHKGTTFTIRLPMSLAVTRSLLVKTNEQIFALPLRFVTQMTEISGAELEKAESLKMIRFGEAEYTFLSLGEILDLPFSRSSNTDKNPLLLIEISDKLYALSVDEIIKPEEIVIKPLGSFLQNLAEYLGATILGDGSVVPVLDLIYLLKAAGSPSSIVVRHSPVRETIESSSNQNKGQRTKDKGLNILIVDDSPSVRHLTSNIIKNANWMPIVAKDGLEALDILQDLRELPDVILTDVEMPRMNGYELLASLKNQENLRAIPVVMITSRANEKHRQKAVDLGVSEYLTKPFDDAKLIEIIKNLIA